MTTPSTLTITLGDLMRATHRVLHLHASGEDLSPSEMDDTIQAHAMMMAEWMSSGLIIYTPVSEDFPIVAGVQNYQIGEGVTAPNFDTVRPSGVHDNAFIRDGSDTDYPVKLMGADQWAEKAVKYVSGPPYFWYYRPDYPIGLIIFDTMPDKDYTFFFDSEKEMAYITDPDTVISLPGYYLNAIKFNLALNIAPEYNKEPTPFLQRRAKETMAVVERRNADNLLEAARLSTFSWQGGSDYDIYSDRWKA